MIKDFAYAVKLLCNRVRAPIDSFEKLLVLGILSRPGMAGTCMFLAMWTRVYGMRLNRRAKLRNLYINRKRIKRSPAPLCLRSKGPDPLCPFLTSTVTTQRFGGRNSKACNELKCTREVIYAQSMQPGIGAQSTKQRAKASGVLKLQDQVAMHLPLSTNVEDLPGLQRTEKFLILLLSLEATLSRGFFLHTCEPITH